jgi:hypothetical protein
MPTRLDKAILREVPRNELIVRIAPEGIYTRSKRSRTWWGPIAWNMVNWQCQKVQIDAILKEKAEQKAARKATRRRR